MTVTDPDVPDPLHDPRTLQADPGARGQGDDLASAGDDPSATGEAESGHAAGLPLTGGIPPAETAVEPDDDADTGEPFTQIAPPS